MRGGVYAIGDAGSIVVHGAENNYITIEPYPGI